MIELPDGSYDVFIIDAEKFADESTRVDLTIVSGANKGDIVSVRATRISRDALELLGLPATLHVVNGEPRVVFDDHVDDR